ncbi:unnamed protein product [Chironomus riparius]|uniref:Uncharacterized protein n=1 Tax=Chironomus riparius TaxID=315576 RepID=A0A9P0IY44_9DIPT|nr:unnamed protein product [Chironomus riparius]
MYIKQFCIILLFFSLKNYAKEQSGTVEEYINKKIEVINTKTTELIEHDVIKLKEPAASLACDNTKGDKIKIIKDVDGYFFFLSVNELLAIKVNGENVAELYFIGTLLDIEENDPIIDIQMERWKNFYMIVIQQSSKLKIYLVKFDITDSPDINHIQKINIETLTDKFKVFRKGNDVHMVIYHINENTENELIFYTWHNSYFSKESTEQAELPNKSDLFVFNESVNETLILSIGYGLGNQSTQVVTFRHDKQSNRWKKLQKMHFKNDYIEHFSIHEKLYIIGCSTDSFCAIYKWSGSNFLRHQKISSSVFEIIKTIYSRHNIIIIENFQNKLSLYSRSDIIGIKAGLVRSKSNDISEYTVYKSREGHLYYVEIAKNETSMRASFYEMSITEVAHVKGTRSDAKDIDPIECVMQLKASMKNRVGGIKSSERNAKSLIENPGKLNINNKKFINARYVNLKDAVVGSLKMPYNVSVVTKDLMENIVTSNVQLEKIRQSLRDGSAWKQYERARENIENEFGNINVNNLVYNGNQLIFKGMVSKSQPVITFTDQVKLSNISANKLDIKSNKINLIPLNKLLNATITKSVKGTKNLQTLRIDETQITEMMNNVPLTFLNSTENKLKQSRKINFNGDINVEHLKVKTLNRFDVTKLMNDLYLKDNKTKIQGDLFVRSSFNVENLFANRIKSIPVNNFMTTSTDQEIQSDTLISKFHASVINANAVNAEDTSNFALINAQNLIEIPTKFMFLNVKENLNIKDGDVDVKEIQNFIHLIKRHVIGTDSSDLAQIYNGKVLIQGSLTLSNMDIFSPKTRIIVNDMVVPLNITDNYWTKSTKQEIYVDNFIISNNAVMNGIITKSLNNHPVNNYLRIDNNVFQGEVQLRFENVIIDGEVKGHPKNYPSLLLQLSQNVIPLYGPPISVSSPVEFRNKLTVKKLYTGSINGISADSLVHKHLQLILFEAPKVVENLNVNNLIVDNSISITNYNNVNVPKFLNDAIRIDMPILLDSLKMKSFNAYNLTVDDLEQHNLNIMIKNLVEELDFSKESSKGKRSIRIHGDATFNANIFIDLLNTKMDFNEFVNLLALNINEPQEIGGKKIFQKGLIITDNLDTKSINGFSTDRLLHSSLCRGDKQTIKGQIFVKTLKVNELHTNKLNEILWNQLINKEELHLPLKINIDLDEIETEDLYTNSTITDFGRMLKIIQFPPRKNWNSITALKGSDILFGTDTYLDRLISDGVVKSVPQEILAQVEIESKFYMRNVMKRDYFINTRTSVIDIKYLNEDSVKDNSSNEIIRGRKTVARGYRFDANNMIIGHQCNFYSTYINNVNVMELNKTICRRSESLNSHKRFANLEVDELYMQSGLLNGVALLSIFQITHDNIRLPEINFQYLEVDNLKTFSFNTYSLLLFLETRLRKYGSKSQSIRSYLTINSVQFDNDTSIMAINNVNLDDAVYLQSDQLQIIDGHKIVTGSVKIIGPAHIGTINNIDIVEFHRNTVDIYQDYRSNVPLKLSQVELKNGMHITKNINDRNIDELLSSNAHSPKLNDLMTLIANVTKQITAIDHEKSSKRKRKRMLYIDVDENIDFQFKTPRSNDGNECSIRNEIDFKPYSKGVIITQKSDLEMSVDLPSVKFKLNPNFDCDESDVNSRKIDLWWNYPNDKERAENTFFRNFTFEKNVTDVKFMESADNKFILIAVALQNVGTSEILFLRLDKATDELIPHAPTIVGFYETSKIAIIESSNKIHYLVVSSFQKETENDKVFIYRFDSTQGQFVQSQKPFSGSNFDIILGINVKTLTGFRGRTFILFAKTNGKQVRIYQRKDETDEFIFHKMIDDFKDSIVEVLVLYINEKPFIIVSQKSGLFCLYEWRGIESWKSKSCGRFENIHQMKSFEYLNRQHLFLASIVQNSTPSINALTIYSQGN